MHHPESRIFFPGNPYPKGHRIKTFDWKIRLIPETGLWFDLHLKTDDYYAEDDSFEDSETEGSWNAKIVWGNYHRCTISSDFWHSGGFAGGTENRKFRFEKGTEATFLIDPLPRPDGFDIDEDAAFGIYLLGHDDCADHKISFYTDTPGLFRIDWKGKIALSYSGDEEFRYDFSTVIHDIPVPEISCPEELSDQEIRYYMEKYATGYEHLKFVKR